MAEGSHGSVYRAFDYLGFSFILVGVEEFGRAYVPNGGPTMQWYVRIAFILIGVALLWMGESGPKIRRRFSDWIHASDLRKENEKLKAEIASQTKLPTINSLNLIHKIDFGYLPISPLENGWKQEYNADGVADFGSDPDINGSLRMKIVQSEVAIHYNLPPHAVLADLIEFRTKHTNGENPTMIFTRLIVTTKDRSVQKSVDIKYYYGEAGVAPTFPNPNPGRGSDKWLPEQTVYLPAQVGPGGQLGFSINLREVVRMALGGQGWNFSSIHGVRLRGNLSISPITLSTTQ